MTRSSPTQTVHALLGAPPVEHPEPTGLRDRRDQLGVPRLDRGLVHRRGGERSSNKNIRKDGGVARMSDPTKKVRWRKRLVQRAHWKQPKTMLSACIGAAPAMKGFARSTMRSGCSAARKAFTASSRSSCTCSSCRFNWSI